MKSIKLISITINPDGSVTDKNGKTIKLLSLEDRIKKDKERGREWNG
jgi:hypothetical protein